MLEGMEKLAAAARYRSNVATGADGRRLGFTLIELSIVLVIIGLLVAGILVGQDLIDAAAIRSQIGQLEKYQTAVNAFRNKYGALPGDIAAAKAATFGLATRTGGSGRGDGNDQLCGAFCPPGGGSNISGENALFWNDLSTAGLIEGTYQGVDCSVNSGCTASSATVPISSIIPAAKAGQGNYISVYYSPTQGANYFQLLSMTGIGADGTALGQLPALTHKQALDIDQKIDDGYPMTGGVQSRDAHLGYSSTPGLEPGNAGHFGYCVASDVTPNVYNVNNNTSASAFYGPCSISIKFQ